MLSVIMLIVIMLNVVMLSVDMLNVVTPLLRNTINYNHKKVCNSGPLGKLFQYSVRIMNDSRFALLQHH
jgi:hypothetical protein